jgi:hypothetical protein
MSRHHVVPVAAPFALASTPRYPRSYRRGGTYPGGKECWPRPIPRPPGGVQ